MKSVSLCLIFVWIAAGAGRVLVGRLKSLRLSPMERTAYATALGLALAGYGVFALGMAGGLSVIPVTAVWVVLAAFGLGGMRANARELLAVVSRRTQPISPEKEHFQPETPLEQWLRRICLSIVLLFGVLAVLACFQPPTGHEWDALAYHLADPKIFLAQHRISSLPTEHHSNFPFTMEMLFTVGLLYAGATDGYALANLFHFVMAALTVPAIVGFCRRFQVPAAGWLAAALFVTTPLVFWEASTAYIDLGVGLFTLLAATAALSASGAEAAEARAWAVLSGTMMGFALGMKYLALLPFAFVGAAWLLRRRSLALVATYAGVALVIGSPWYLKNVVLMRNPVYPFYYSVFSQSTYWSADRAATYQAEQQSFGFPHSLKEPQVALLNLVQTPWLLMTRADRYANQGDYTFSILIGGLYAGFGFALVFLRKTPRPVADIAALGLAQLAAWFFLAQIGRYVVSMLPFFAIVAGYGAWRLIAAGKWLRPVALVAVGGQAALMLWSAFFLPTSPRQAAERGVLTTTFSAPEALTDLTQPDTRDTRLKHGLDIYSAIEWINGNTPTNAGVILYDETRGFYLNRPYLWGNGEHSAYIPYDTLHDAAALTAWLRAHGIQYALINLKFSPKNDPAKPDPALPTGPVGAETEALQRWYAETDAPPGTWRHTVGEALTRGGWTTQFAQNGVVVVQTGASDRPARNAGRSRVVVARGQARSRRWKRDWQRERL